MPEPTTRQRVAFWLLLGLTSTAFAEVLFPTTAFDPLTLVLIAVPIYLLYSVVLASVVFRAEGVRYSSLYLAGVLLALYESYVTKVVWAPLADQSFLVVGGVHVFETAGLVLFWHPIVSFLLPVTVIEWVATSSRRSLRPPLAGHRFSRPLAVGVAAYLLLFQGGLGGPIRATVGNAVALAVLLTALAAWRRAGGHVHEMRPLLPRGRSLHLLAAILVVASVGYAALIRPEALPTRPTPHLLILGIYAVSGILLAGVLRGEGVGSPSASLQFTWRRILAGAGAIALATPVLGLVGSLVALPLFLSYYIVALGVGTASLAAISLTLWS